MIAPLRSMTESKPKIGGLLLAAGGSRRLGSPKQLLEFEGKTLIRRAAEALIDAGCDPAVVILGAEVERSRTEIADLPVEVIDNAEWETGMSSSIRVGVSQIASREIDAVLVTLCDQPHVTGEKLLPFIDKFLSIGSPIVAAEYNGVRGVPALFAREMFDQLLKLEGDNGARDLIRRGRSVAIDLPEAEVDIDTVDTAENLTK